MIREQTISVKINKRLPRPIRIVVSLLMVQLMPLAGCGPGREPAPAVPPLPEKAMLGFAQLTPPVAKPVNPPDAKALPARTEKLVAEAEKLLAAKDFSAAVEKLERAAGFAPGNPRIRRQLGLTYAALANPGKAEDNLRRAVKVAPDDLEAQLLLGHFAAAEKQTHKAILSLRTAMKCSGAAAQEPLAAEALLLLGNLLYKEGYWTASLECFDRLHQWIDSHGQDYMTRAKLSKIVLRPERLLKLRGSLLVALRRPAEAVELLGRAHDRDRSDPGTTGLLFKALLTSGKHGEAESLLLEVARDPAQRVEISGLVDSLVHEYAARGKAEEALRFLVGLLAARSEFTGQVRRGVGAVAGRLKAGYERKFAEEADLAAPAGRYAWQYVAGQLAEARGNAPLAMKLYDRAIDAKDDFYPAYEALLNMHLAGGRYPDADRIVERVRKLAPEGYYRYYLKGKVRFARGRVREAVDALQQARERNQQHIPTLLLLADGYDRLGRSDDAVRALMTAVNYRHGDPESYGRLVRLYVGLGLYKNARAAIMQLLRRRPNSIQGRIWLAEVLLLSGRGDQAGEIAAQLSRQAANHPGVEVLSIRLKLLSPERMPARGEVADAAARLEKILRNNPDYETAAMMLGEALAKLGRNADALKVWQDLYLSSLRRPDVAQAYAAALVRADRCPEAAKVLEDLLAAQPAERQTFQMTMDVLEQLKQFDRAASLVEEHASNAESDEQKTMYRTRLLALYEKAKAYDKAQKLLDDWSAEPGLKESFVVRLRAGKIGLYGQAGKYDQAVEVASKLIQRYPEADQLRQVLIGALVDAKQYDRAQALLDEWIAGKTGKSVRMFRTLKLFSYARAEKFDEAQALASTWIEEAPQNRKPRELIISVLIEGEQYARALKLVDGWIAELAATAQPAATQPATQSTRPAKPPELLAWCRETALGLLMMQGDYEAALKRAENYIKDEPDNVSLLNTKSSCLTELGRADEAQAVLEKTLSLKADDPGTNNNLGYMYADSGIKLARAESMIRKAIAARPNAIAFMDSLGWVLYKQGGLARAGRQFEDILERIRTDEMGYPVIYDHAGDAYYRLGWKDKAVELWRKALDSAKEQKQATLEVRKVVTETPGKIKAVESNRKAKVAPLGEGVKSESK